jgi:hypothetical protein
LKVLIDGNVSIADAGTILSVTEWYKYSYFVDRIASLQPTRSFASTIAPPGSLLDIQDRR